MERSKYLTLIAIPLAIAISIQVAHAVPISLETLGYKEPFMLIDITGIGPDTLVVTLHGLQANGQEFSHGFQGGNNSSGAIQWDSTTKISKASFHWVRVKDVHGEPVISHADVNVSNKSSIWGAKDSTCLQGNQIMSITGNSQNNAVYISCNTVPLCSSGQSVTMASGKTYCAP